MKKKLKVVAMTTLMVAATLLVGCGHNFGVNSKGVGMRAAWNPDSLMPELSLGYYEVGSIAVRENATAIYETDSVGALTGDAIEGEATGTVGSKLSIETGAQANGYTIKNELLTNEELSN